MQKDDQRERMSKTSKDMSDHTGREDKSQMQNKDQGCPTKGGTVQESKTNPSDILDEVESLEEEWDYPPLTCEIFQCRHCIPLRDVPYPLPVEGRCALEQITIRQKTRTICSDGTTRYTAQWPEFVCDGFEWYSPWAGEDDAWVAVAEVRDWPGGPDIDGRHIRQLVDTFELLRRKPPVEDPPDETTEEVSEVIPKEKPASNVIEFPADLSRR